MKYHTYTVALVALMMSVGTTLAQTNEINPAPKEQKPTATVEGTMTLVRMGEIINRLDDKARAVNAGTAWQFHVEKVPVVIVTDVINNRMRIMTAVKKAEDLSADELLRIAQANFDTTLDARYAVANGLVWATFIHPLSTLHDRQLIEGIGQTVNAAKSYGTTFSSGLMSFGGGDSGAIIQRDLIDKLLKKGQEI